MLIIRAATTKLQGEVSLPASKSICNRVLVIRSLSGDSFDVKNISTANDSQNLLENLEKLKDKSSKIKKLDVGPAGTNMRFLMSVLVVIDGEYVLQGSERMHQRPVKELVKALRALGADIEYTGEDGFPPLKVKNGDMTGGHVEMNAEVSSQFISSLMMIGPVLPRGLKIKLNGEVVSRPYIDMTARIMKSCGARVSWQENLVTIEPGGYHREEDFFVEADWSAASYWYAMASLSSSSNLVLNGLQHESLQGDSVLKDWFREFGIVTEFSDNQARILKKSNPAIKAFEKDLKNNPDLAQTFIVLLSALEVKGRLSGLETLRIKETDRIEAMKIEMAKFGVELFTENDVVTIPAVRPAFSDTRIETWHDHRMAMAMSLLSYRITPLYIEDEGVVAKSYPGFWDDLKTLGFQIDKV